MNEYSDEYETYGYAQLEQEYFDSHPEIYSQEMIDNYAEIAFENEWIQ